MIIEEEIKEYFREIRLGDNIAKRMYRAIKNHNDLFQEFLKFIETRSYPTREEGAVVVLEYIAQDIKNLAPNYEGVGVYNFLSMLRDAPNRAKELMANGFSLHV